MPRRIIFLSLAVLLPLAAFAQTPPKPPVSAPPAAAPAGTPHPEGSHEAKSYTPGIEQCMNVIQTEHAKLWYAASARNWELAAYQLGEIKEIMSDVEDLYPTFKDLPLGKMLDDVITGPIAAAEKTLDAKDFGKFSAAYGKLTDACNACHQATGMGFVVIQRPSGPAFPNQDFRPHKQ
jgi:hypothetical protein